MKHALLLSSLVACAPAWPDGAALTAGRTTGTNVELIWPAVDGADTFRVMQGDRVLSEALAGNATRFVAGALDDGVTYSFSVQARGQNGSWSRPLHLEVTTPDTTPPKWKQPARFRVTVEAESEQDARLKLTWGDAEDNVGVDGFFIHHRPGEPIPIAGDVREHVLESVIPDGIWQLEAKDKAGNSSEVLAFNVETDLTQVRRDNLKARAIDVFSGRDKGTDANMFGPDGLAVPVDGPEKRDPKRERPRGPVWLGEGGNLDGRAWASIRLSAVEQCYSEARKADAALAGVLTVPLVVDGSGEVNVSRMDGIKHSGLRTCVRQALRGRMPKEPAAAFRTEVTIHMTASERD